MHVCKMLCLSSSPSTDISEAQHVRGRPAVSQTHHHHHHQTGSAAHQLTDTQSEVQA